MASAFQPPEYLISAHPDVQLCVERIHAEFQHHADFLQRADFNQSGCNVEFESRFGTIGENGFTAGVSKSFMQRALTMMNDYKEWKQITKWKETQDFYYELPPSPEDLHERKKLVRTSVEFADNKKHLTHIYKVCHMKQDMKFSASASHPQDPVYDLRTALNLEYTVPENEIPDCVNPTRVVIKSRSTFVYVSNAMWPFEWHFDFTRKWVGSTRAEAEKAQSENNTIYEIELECVNLMDFIKSKTTDLYYVITSMMLKMKDFMGENRQFQWKPYSYLPTF